MRAALVQGGTDADCPAGKSMYASYMMDALADGAIARADIDRAARRVFRTIFRLGMLGTPLPNPAWIDRDSTLDPPIPACACRLLAKTFLSHQPVFHLCPVVFLTRRSVARRPDG